MRAQLAYSCSGPSYFYPAQGPEESVCPPMSTPRDIPEALWEMEFYLLISPFDGVTIKLIEHGVVSDLASWPVAMR